MTVTCPLTQSYDTGSAREADAAAELAASQRGKGKPKFHSARHVLTRHVRRVEPMHFGCVELNCRTARLDTLVSTRSTRRTCCVVSRRDVTSQVKFGLMQTLIVSTSLRPSWSKPSAFSTCQLANSANLERKISSSSDDKREGAFLFQSFGAVLLHDTLPAPDCID